MRASKELLKKNINQLILYGIIGCLAAAIDYFFYSLLTACVGLYYIIANSISVFIGILTSFSLNRTFNFKVTDKKAVRFGLFLVVGIFGLVLSNVILWIGVNNLHFQEKTTKVASIFLVAFIQFLFNKFITFRQTK